jgi:small subunit ribosomal protein S20
MANIASQRKRNARSLRERDENRRLTSAVKTHFRRLEAAVGADDSAAADTEHRLLISRIDKAVQRGALHANNGARKKARAARIRGGAGSS